MRLQDVRTAILVADGFEEVELTDPRRALDEAGADTEIISPVQRWVKAWNKDNWGAEFPVDVTLSEAIPERYQALLLPGGVMNPDELRTNETALDFVRHFTESNKPIASICHGPWILINVGAVRGRRLTSYASIRKDLENAGAKWIDSEVVIDGNLVTSRKPDDLPAFIDVMLSHFSESEAVAQADRKAR